MKILKLNLSKDEDPTQQGRNRKSLNKKIKVRLANAQKQVIELFNGISRQSRTEKNLQLNQETFTVYDYDFTPEEQERFESQIYGIVALFLLEGGGQNKPIDFYSDSNTEEAYRTGALEVFRDTNSDLAKIALLGASAGAFASLLPRSIDVNIFLFSQEYLRSVAGYQNDMFYQLKGLSEKTSSQVYERIYSGIKGKKTPRSIIRDIKKRFNVAESNASRIVQTEINKAYNDSIMGTINFINATTNVNAVGRHKSALLSTTRQNHAARHNKLYTTAQQLAWWNLGTNRINCYCSFRIVLLDDKNNVILES